MVMYAATWQRTEIAAARDQMLPRMVRVELDASQIASC